MYSLHVYYIRFFFLFILITAISPLFPYSMLFFFNDTATTEIYTFPTRPLPISYAVFCLKKKQHTSELQSRSDLVCRLILKKKKPQTTGTTSTICCNSIVAFR